MTSQTRKEVVVSLHIDGSQISEEMRRAFQDSSVTMNITPSGGGGMMGSSGRGGGIPGINPMLYQAGGPGGMGIPWSSGSSVGGGGGGGGASVGDFKQQPWFQMLQAQQLMGSNKQSLSSVTGGQDPLERLQVRRDEEKNIKLIPALDGAIDGLKRLSAELEYNKLKLKDSTLSLEDSAKTTKRNAQILKDQQTILESAGAGEEGNAVTGIKRSVGMAAVAGLITTALKAPANFLGGQAAAAQYEARGYSATFEKGDFNSLLRTKFLKEDSGGMAFGGAANVTIEAVKNILPGVIAGFFSGGAGWTLGAAGAVNTVANAQRYYTEGQEDWISKKISKEAMSAEGWKRGVDARVKTKGMQDAFGLNESEMRGYWGDRGSLHNLIAGDRMTVDELSPGLVSMSRMGRGALGGAGTMSRMIRATGMEGGELGNIAAGFSGLSTTGMSPNGQMDLMEGAIARGFRKGYEDTPLVREQLGTLLQIAKGAGGGYGGTSTGFGESMVSAATGVLGAGTAALQGAATTSGALKGIFSGESGPGAMASAVATQKMMRSLIDRGVDPAAAMLMSRIFLKKGPDWLNTKEASDFIKKNSGIRMSDNEASAMAEQVSRDKMGSLEQFLPEQFRGPGIPDTLKWAAIGEVVGGTAEGSVGFGEVVAKWVKGGMKIPKGGKMRPGEGEEEYKVRELARQGSDLNKIGAAKDEMLMTAAYDPENDVRKFGPWLDEVLSKSEEEKLKTEQINKANNINMVADLGKEAGLTAGELKTFKEELQATILVMRGRGGADVNPTQKVSKEKGTPSQRLRPGKSLQAPGG